MSNRVSIISTYSSPTLKKRHWEHRKFRNAETWRLEKFSATGICVKFWKNGTLETLRETGNLMKFWKNSTLKKFRIGMTLKSNKALGKIGGPGNPSLLGNSWENRKLEKTGHSKNSEVFRN